MALVADKWMVTNIDREVLIIENPGQDDEIVHFRFKPNQQADLFHAMKGVQKFDIDPDKKCEITFWIGYFYAHLGRRAGG